MIPLSIPYSISYKIGTYLRKPRSAEDLLMVRDDILKSITIENRTEKTEDELVALEMISEELTRLLK